MPPRERIYSAAPAGLRRERDAALALKVLELRAIIEGRTTPPTDAEIAAHDAAGGVFGFFCREEGYYTGSTVEEIRQPLPPGRWWAHAADGRPCAWPEVPR